MSRTKRRLKPNTVRYYLREQQEHQRLVEENGYQHLEDNGVWLPLPRGVSRMTADQLAAHHVSWFTRDHRSGCFLRGWVPRWYRMQHGAHIQRRVEKAKLHRCLRNGDWDNHLPDSRLRDTMYYWWY